MSRSRYFFYILYIERGEGKERRTKTICRCGLNLANTSRLKGEGSVWNIFGFEIVGAFCVWFFFLSTYKFRTSTPQQRQVYLTALKEKKTPNPCRFKLEGKEDIQLLARWELLEELRFYHWYFLVQIITGCLSFDMEFVSFVTSNRIFLLRKQNPLYFFRKAAICSVINHKTLCHVEGNI